jgi:phosphoribosyl-ATP pyrophosphohydrolase
MYTNNVIKKILNWLEIAGVPKEGSDQQFQLWLNLMDEEFEETIMARMDNNREEEVDGLADLIWVVCNWAHMNNLPLLETLQKVEQSNYSKFAKTEKEAQDTVDAYSKGLHWDKKGESIDAHYVKVDDFYIIKRKSDDKILKSIQYIPVKNIK